MHTTLPYSSVVELDLSEVQPALAGPKRPQDRILLSDMRGTWALDAKNTFGHAEEAAPVSVSYKDQTFELKDGAVVIAAITSCTNTSNPAVMIGAGLVAQKANALGLTAKPWVKTSLAPGSRVVTEYFDKADLTKELEALGFYTVGYGCTTCIGNSGPLADPIRDAIVNDGILATSVLSGNRNFEGRVSPHTSGNYLASPPLVVAYAIAGTVDIDLHTDSLGKDRTGNDVFLKDIWPTNEEIAGVLSSAVNREQFMARYENVYHGPDAWRALDAPTDQVFQWKDASTYIQEPPFFIDMPLETPTIQAISAARVLVKCGQSTTTDHISPAGAIPPDSPAAEFLMAKGVARRDWNSFGSRRGNDRIMTRGTFGNIRLKNHMAPGTEGGYTTYMGPGDAPVGDFSHMTYDSAADPKNGEQCFIYDASVKYQKHGIPLLVIAGKDYGMGSSRDWAAKGTYLLGVRAVIAESYERIHRSNLIGMGVLPLQFADGETPETLGLTGKERFDIQVDDGLQPLQGVNVVATDDEGHVTRFTTRCRIDTPVEVDYYRNGGILHTVLRRLASE